ncbi:MAG: SCP2 sterol-binding domain-containing protein [Steroidobacteraceae bacterium]
MLLSAIETTLNRNIAASSAARALCARLNGKSLRLQLTGMPTAFLLRAIDDRIQLSTQNDSGDSAADASLSGSPLGLLNLAQQQSTAALQGSSVRIEGDAEVAQSFSELLKQAKPDLEEELSRVVGDVAAHQLGNTVRSLLGFGHRVGSTLLQNVGEYLSEESRDVPSKTEADEFNHDVDVLRDDAERFAARLSALERKTATNKQ